MAVYSFTPPTDNVTPPILPDTKGLAFLLFRHYASTARGRNVFIINGTTVTEADPLGTDTVNRAFYGGHGPYTDVTDAEAALLTAAGYVVS